MASLEIADCLWWDARSTSAIRIEWTCTEYNIFGSASACVSQCSQAYHVKHVYTKNIVSIGRIVYTWIKSIPSYTYIVSYTLTSFESTHQTAIIYKMLKIENQWSDAMDETEVYFNCNVFYSCFHGNFPCRLNRLIPSIDAFSLFNRPNYKCSLFLYEPSSDLRRLPAQHRFKRAFKFIEHDHEMSLHCVCLFVVHKIWSCVEIFGFPLCLYHSHCFFFCSQTSFV